MRLLDGMCCLCTVNISTGYPTEQTISLSNQV